MSSRRIESFLLRVVVDEQSAPEEGLWRGRIHYVSSGSEHQFKHMNDMLVFIHRQLAAQQSFTLAFETQPTNE